MTLIAPLLVVRLAPLARSTVFAARTLIAFALCVLIALLIVMVSPYSVIGPVMFRALESTRFEVLELLPRVTPAKLLSKVMPLTVNVPLKLVPTGSIVRLPEPV